MSTGGISDDNDIITIKRQGKVFDNDSDSDHHRNHNDKNPLLSDCGKSARGQEDNGAERLSPSEQFNFHFKADNASHSSGAAASPMGYGDNLNNNFNVIQLQRANRPGEHTTHNQCRPPGGPAANSKFLQKIPRSQAKLSKSKSGAKPNRNARHIGIETNSESEHEPSEKITDETCCFTSRICSS